MSVSKNEKTGKWDVRVWYRDITGERRQTTKRGFRTKREAQTYETDFLLKQQGQLDMKFGDFVDLYLDRFSYSQQHYGDQGKHRQYQDTAILCR